MLRLSPSFAELPCSKRVEVEVERDHIGIDHPLTLSSGAVDPSTNAKSMSARRCIAVRFSLVIAGPNLAVGPRR